MKSLLYFALALLFILHNDLWYWNDPQLVMGLPIGLFYHIAYCGAASVLMYLLIKFAWPDFLQAETEEDPS